MASAVLAAAAAVAAGDNFYFMDNGVIRVGVDASRGGSIGWLSPSGSSYNVIDDHDQGREIQLSFYSGPDPYNPNGLCESAWYPWPWNPIGAGDVMGNAGTVLNVVPTDTNILVTSRPLQWACNNVACECIFNQSVSLAPGATWLTATATIINSRANETDWGNFGQELPATYAIGDFYQLVTYRGSAPWTNAPVEDIPTPQPQPPWNPGSIVTTENWAAFMGTSGLGMGIYSPGYSSMLAGFHGTPGGGSGDDSTGYIAPNALADLTYNIVFSYDYSVVLGDLATIRSYAYQTHAAAAAAGSLPPHHDFKGNAAYVHAVWLSYTAQRHSTEGALTFAGGSVDLFSPVQTWQAAEVPLLYIRMAVTASQGVRARVWSLPLSERALAPVDEAAYANVTSLRDPQRLNLRYGGAATYAGNATAEWSVVADGVMRDYAVQLQGNAAYVGVQQQLKLVVDAGNEPLRVSIERISRYE